MDTQLIEALESGVKKQNKRIRKLMIGAVILIGVGAVIGYLSVMVISPSGSTFFANILFLIGAFMIILGLSILIMWPIAQIKGRMQVKKAEARVEHMDKHNNKAVHEK